MLERHIPLLLCCAEDNEVALVRVVDILHREGYAPEVVSGIDHDAALLTAAVDRVSGAALFVFCQSTELDRARIRRLIGLFSARRGDAQASLVVQLRGDRPLTILPPIRTAVDGVLDGTYLGEGAESAERSGRREVIHAPELSMEKLVTPSRRKRDPVAERSGASKRSERDGDEPWSMRGRGSELSGIPELLQGPDDVRAIDPSRDDLDAFVHETARTQTSQAPSPPIRGDVPPVQPVPRQVPIVLGTAFGTAALILVGALSLRPDKAASTTVDASTAATAPEPASGDVAVQSPSVPAVAAARPLIPPPPSIAAAEPSAPTPLPPALERLLAAGEAKRFRDLLVLSVSPEPTTWSMAAQHCAGHDGSLGARLPTRRELRSLERSAALPPGTYWSSELGDHEDEAHAVDVPSGQTNVYLHEESIGLAACIVQIR